MSKEERQSEEAQREARKSLQLTNAKFIMKLPHGCLKQMEGRKEENKVTQRTVQLIEKNGSKYNGSLTTPSEDILHEFHTCMTRAKSIVLETCESNKAYNLTPFKWDVKLSVSEVIQQYKNCVSEAFKYEQPKGWSYESEQKMPNFLEQFRQMKATSYMTKVFVAEQVARNIDQNAFESKRSEEIAKDLTKTCQRDLATKFPVPHELEFGVYNPETKELMDCVRNYFGKS